MADFVVGKLYSLHSGCWVSMTSPTEGGSSQRALYKNIDESAILLFLKEKPIPNTYDGVGPSAKQIKELFFLHEDRIWSITSNMAEGLEQVK